MPFGVRRHLPEGARYITFLRDPVERTLSQYYSVRAGINEASLERDVALDEVIARDLIADNLQTRMLSDELDPTAAPSEEMLAQAKTNLRDGFAAFGVVERFDESFLLVMRRLGSRRRPIAAGESPTGFEATRSHPT